MQLETCALCSTDIVVGIESFTGTTLDRDCPSVTPREVRPTYALSCDCTTITVSVQGNGGLPLSFDTESLPDHWYTTDSVAAP